MRKVYLIGLNNSLILDLAVALKEKGYEEISGSDEEISEKNRQRLDAVGISYHIPWNPSLIDINADYIVPAAHIPADNPEILQAKTLKLQVLSMPEFVYDCFKGKTRAVIAGTKGKKELMSMILKVLKKQKIAFDYITSHFIPGIDKLVHLSYDARIAIIEAEELTSSLAKKHKLEFYRPHIALIPNIIWKEDTLPTQEDTIRIFRDFAQTIERDGKFIYNEQDEVLKEFAEEIREDITAIPYTEHLVIREGTKVYLDTRFGKYPVQIDNEYFLENLNGARYACRHLGVSDKDFYTAISEISMQG